MHTSSFILLNFYVKKVKTSVSFLIFIMHRNNGSVMTSLLSSPIFKVFAPLKGDAVEECQKLWIRIKPFFLTQLRDSFIKQNGIWSESGFQTENLWWEAQKSSGTKVIHNMKNCIFQREIYLRNITPPIQTK